MAKNIFFMCIICVIFDIESGDNPAIIKHQKTNKMENINQRVFELLEKTGLNWEVSKEPLISLVDQSPTRVFGTFKKTSRQFLGAVKSRYEVYQNYQLAEAIVTAADSINVTYDKGGEMKRGKRVFLQATLPDEYIGKSVVKRNLTALNSHDGTTSIAFGSSNTVVVCENTFFRAYKDLSKFKHSVNAPQKVKALAMDMNAAIRADEALMNNFKLMSDIRLEDNMVDKVINKIFKINGHPQDDISTRKKNIIETFNSALDTEIKLEGNNLWGLFNAVTRYTNHIASPDDDGSRLDYIMAGGGYKLSNMTYDLLMDEIKEKVYA
jgi:phage/plasmid-like protein (TIGR03299 family)